jgi:hypothetical protein
VRLSEKFFAALFAEIVVPSPAPTLKGFVDVVFICYTL